MEERYWTQWITDVLPGRVEKPRISGLSMIIDTGIPTSTMRDVLQLASDHIDYWKLGFASASVCPVERIMDKVTLCQEYGVLAYPGGTALEIAYTQGVWREYLQSLWDHGIRVVEVSDGTIDLPQRSRREIIRTARKIGFTVLSEIGKKLPGSFLPIPEQAHMIHGDLNSGANYIIVEGREAGMGVGVYDAEGNVKTQDVNALLDTLGPLSTRLIWEAPLSKQQTFYVKSIGNHVNLGNIKPFDIITLESLRRGYRSDTLRSALGLTTAPPAPAPAPANGIVTASTSIEVAPVTAPTASTIGIAPATAPTASTIGIAGTEPVMFEPGGSLQMVEQSTPVGDDGDATPEHSAPIPGPKLWTQSLPAARGQAHVQDRWRKHVN